MEIEVYLPYVMISEKLVVNFYVKSYEYSVHSEENSSRGYRSSDISMKEVLKN
jgi:hypothetical protein